MRPRVREGVGRAPLLLSLLAPRLSRRPRIGPAMPPPGQTQLPDWDGLKLRVRTLIASHRVMIFSKSYCPYCNKVRRRRRPGVASARSPPPGPSSPGRQPPQRGLSEQRPSSSAGRKASRRGEEAGLARPPCEARDICPEGARSQGWRPAPAAGSAQGKERWAAHAAGMPLRVAAPLGCRQCGSSSASAPLKLSTECRP